MLDAIEVMTAMHEMNCPQTENPQTHNHVVYSVVKREEEIGHEEQLRLEPKRLHDQASCYFRQLIVRAVCALM